MKTTALRIVLCFVMALTATVVTSCQGTQNAQPQPTSTASYYSSLKAANVKGTDFISSAGAIQLGQMVCEKLQAKRNVMWIIKNIITLNGPNDGIDLSADERYQFAIAVLASATTHLCPDMKDYVLAPHN